MTRPILHRQSGYWTNIASYAKPDLYASLAAVTLPDSGKPYRGTASKATDLTWANACRHRAGRASPEPQSTVRLGHSATIAFAIDALMWAVFAGCFLLLASGAL